MRDEVKRRLEIELVGFIHGATTARVVDALLRAAVAAHATATSARPLPLSKLPVEYRTALRAAGGGRKVTPARAGFGAWALEAYDRASKESSVRRATSRRRRR